MMKVRSLLLFTILYLLSITLPKNMMMTTEKAFVSAATITKNVFPAPHGIFVSLGITTHAKNTNNQKGKKSKEKKSKLSKKSNIDEDNNPCQGSYIKYIHPLETATKAHDWAEVASQKLPSQQQSTMMKEKKEQQSGDQQNNIEEARGYSSPTTTTTPAFLPPEDLNHEYYTQLLPIPFSSTVPAAALKKRLLVTAKRQSPSEEEENKEEQEGVKKKDYAHMFTDPRYMRIHGYHGGNEHIPHPEKDNYPTEHYQSRLQDRQETLEEKLHTPVSDALYIAEEETEHLWLPAGVIEFTLFCYSTNYSKTFSVRHPLVKQKHERLETLATSDIIHESWVVGPPETQLNIIFVSGGFTQSEKQKFFDNATNLKNLLMDPALIPKMVQDATDAEKDMHRSVPFNRYWPFFNVYAVFQPSAQSGASRPLYNLAIDNNLKCQHPGQIERAVFCDRDLSLALADTTPARPILRPDRSLIVAIVNTPLYGGSGIYIKGKLHMGNFFNDFDLSNDYQRGKMLSLVDHEIGHSFGNLADEYDVGTTEPLDRPLLNCQIGQGGGPPVSPRWSHWITIARQDANWQSKWAPNLVPLQNKEWSILATPEAVCGFQNYYKPAKHCMMHRLTDYFMCPVCREQSTLTIMGEPFEYSWPRFPLKDTVILVPNYVTNDSTSVNTNTALILHLPVQLTSANNYEITWKDVDGTVLPPDPKPECPVCVRLNATNFAKYPVGQIVKVTATIVDKTVFITDTYSSQVQQTQLTQTTYFQIMVVSSLTGYVNVTAVPGKLRPSVGEHQEDLLTHYVQCPWPGPNGSIPLCNLTFPNRAYSAPPSVAAQLAALENWVFIVVGALALVFLLLWLWAANKYQRNSQGRVRPIMQTEFSCFISLIRGIMMGAAIIFMLASLATMGLACYYYTQTTALGKLVIFLGIGLATGLYMMAFIGYWSVASRSKRMLLVNGAVLFLGAGILGAVVFFTDQIAKDMMVEDSYWTVKLIALWQWMVSTYPDRACAIQEMLQCSGFVKACNSVVGSSLDCPGLCPKTNEQFPVPCRDLIRKYIKESFPTVVKIVGACAILLVLAIVFNFINFCALVKLKRDIRAKSFRRVQSKVPKHEQQQVNQYKALYMLKTLDDSDTDHLVKEFRRMDTNKDGQIDKKEMYLFFKRGLCYVPTALEINTIYELGDVDKNSTLSLAEFLAIFGKKVPASMSGGQKGAALMEQSKMDEVQRRVRAKFGENSVMTSGYSSGGSPRMATPAQATARQAMSPTTPNPARRQNIDDYL